MDSNKEVVELKKQLQKMQLHLQSITDAIEPEDVEQIKTYISQTSDVVKGHLDQASQHIKEKWDTSKDVAKTKGKEVNEYVHENPWQVAAIGALVGMAVVGMIKKNK